MGCVRSIGDPSESEDDPGPAVYLAPLACALVVAYVFARLADMVGADEAG